MLFHIPGDIDIEVTLVSNNIPAIPSKGMQVVLNQPHTAWASQFTDLVQMTLELAKHQDFTSIQSTCWNPRESLLQEVPITKHRRNRYFPQSGSLP